MLSLNLHVRTRSSSVVSLKCHLEFLFLFFAKMRYRLKVVGIDNNHAVSWNDGHCEPNALYSTDNWPGMFLVENLLSYTVLY